jgi:hypothetical protein
MGFVILREMPILHNDSKLLKLRRRMTPYRKPPACASSTDDNFDKFAWLPSGIEFDEAAQLLHDLNVFLRLMRVKQRFRLAE